MEEEIIHNGNCECQSCQQKDFEKGLRDLECNGCGLCIDCIEEAHSHWR